MYRSSILFSIITALCILSACSGGKKLATETPLEKSLLWEISAKNMAHSSYLYGTMHLIGKSNFFMSDSVKSKFAKADKLVLELKMDDPGMQSEIIKGMPMQNGATISGLLGDSYSRIRKILMDSLNVNIQMFDGFKPLLVQPIFLTSMLGEQLESYEMSFMQMAASQRKEIIGLETVGFQLAMFDSIPYSEQVESIRLLADSFSVQKKLLVDMIDAYVAEDLDRLAAIMTEQDDFQQHAELLLDARNRNWIARIEELIHNEPVFIAVGAGHLPGKNGVINLLRQAGYEVRSVPAPH